MDLSEVRIYTPEFVEKPKPLNFGQDLTYAKMLYDASENGSFRVGLDPSLVSLLATKIYNYPDEGFRELYFNAARACRTARKQYGANPRIEITLLVYERKLIIHEVDSLGISQLKFKELFTALGKSDNSEGTEVGQFGIGRAAYTTLSDTILIETYSREDGSKYAVLGRSGVEYTIAPKPDLDTYGTRITLVLKEDIDINHLVDYIIECCAFSGIETYLNLDTDARYVFHSVEKGRRRLGPLTYEEYIRKRMKGHNIAGTIFISTPDFDLFGVLSTSYMYGAPDEVRLLGAPIYCYRPFEYNPFTAYVVNVKDERKFPPVASRSSLTAEAEKKLREAIEPKLREELTKRFGFNDPDKLIKSGLFEMETADEIAHYLPKDVATLYKTMMLRDKREKESLYYLWNKSKERTKVYLRTEDHEAIRKISKFDPNAEIFVFTRVSDEQKEVLKKLGFLGKKEFFAKHPEASSGIPVHRSYKLWHGIDVECKIVDSLDEKTIRIPPGNLMKYIALLKEHPTSYGICKDSKKLTGGIALDDFVEKLKTKKVMTTAGPKTFEELLSASPALVPCKDESLNSLIEFSKVPVVFAPDDTLFEILVFFTYHGVEDYKVDRYAEIVFNTFSSRRPIFYGRDSIQRLKRLSWLLIERTVRDERLLELAKDSLYLEEQEERIEYIVRTIRELQRELDKVHSIPV